MGAYKVKLLIYMKWNSKINLNTNLCHLLLKLIEKRKKRCRDNSGSIKMNSDSFNILRLGKHGNERI